MGLVAVAVPVLFLAVGGAVAYLAGAAGLAETRRLRQVGIETWALVKQRPVQPGDQTGRSAPLLQFATEQGLVMEVFSPVRSTRSGPLVDEQHVQVTYDPADPRCVLVHGRERRGIEYAFLGLGACVVLTALTLFVAGA
ncbi:hypothetical protein ABIA33_005909 [Streptacidiphilus sp. MAP12-16]|uniref:DUF3592 domain-containing protein n=1 Tax=Streptacidiphilus sp. MAP12-16 TaxID=3156300 RepID=UPI00351705F3